MEALGWLIHHCRNSRHARSSSSWRQTGYRSYRSRASDWSRTSRNLGKDAGCGYLRHGATASGSTGWVTLGGKQNVLTKNESLIICIGTVKDPIVVKGFGPEQYIGCTGCPVDSHVVVWLTTSRERPIERCPECGSVYKLEYVGPEDDGHHGHEAHGHADADGVHTFEGEPKTMADFVRPEYR